MTEFILQSRESSEISCQIFPAKRDITIGRYTLRLFARNRIDARTYQDDAVSLIILGGENKYDKFCKTVFEAAREQSFKNFVKMIKEQSISDFSIIAHYKHDNNIVIFNDHAGAFPIFIGRLGNNLYVSSNPDAIGVNTNAEYDNISIIEMEKTERICFPYTLYRGVSQIDPHNCLLINYEGALEEVDVGYKPLILRPEDMADSLVEELNALFGGRLIDRKLRIPLSGGLDSRIILAVADKYCDVDTFSISEGLSRDLIIARLVADFRKRKNQEFQLNDDNYDGISTMLGTLVSSQHNIYHAHFYPLFEKISGENRMLVGGYGSNTSFGNYRTFSSSRKKIENIINSDTAMPELEERWNDHIIRTKKITGSASERLAGMWPCSQKIAFAHFRVARHFVHQLEPFMASRLVYSAQLAPDVNRLNIQRKLFQIFCADEKNLPVTTASHPLGSAELRDPSLGLPSHGWPRKWRLYGDSPKVDLRYAEKRDSWYIKMINSINKSWRGG